MTSFTYTSRLELRFDAIPTRPVRERLKEHGFQWDPRAGVWWLARPVNFRFVNGRPLHQDGWQVALNLCRSLGLTDAQAAELTRHREGAIETACLHSMEEACGIA